MTNVTLLSDHDEVNVPIHKSESWIMVGWATRTGGGRQPSRASGPGEQLGRYPHRAWSCRFNSLSARGPRSSAASRHMRNLYAEWKSSSTSPSSPPSPSPWSLQLRASSWFLVRLHLSTSALMHVGFTTSTTKPLFSFTPLQQVRTCDAEKSIGERFI